MDLYQPFIPPIPAFLKAISFLEIARLKIAIMDTVNDMGNGKTICNMIIMAMDIDNQIREFHLAGLFTSAIRLFSPL